MNAHKNLVTVPSNTVKAMKNVMTCADIVVVDVLLVVQVHCVVL